MSHRYRICGLTLSSELALPGLDPASDDRRADLTITLATGPVPTPPAGWFCVTDDEGFRIGLADDAGPTSRFVVRFEDLADLVIDRAGSSIALHAWPGLPGDTAVHLVADHGVPLAMARRGHPVLHGCSVRLGGRAVVVAGPSGRGKSTLAAALLRHGGALLADDHAVLEPAGDGWQVRPSYPSLRLFERSATVLGDAGAGASVAHYTDKLRFEVERAGLARCDEPTPLAAVFVLGPPTERCSIEPLGLADAFTALAETAFHLRSPQEPSAELFEQFGSLARTVPVLALSYPRRWDVFGEVCTAVAEVASSPAEHGSAPMVGAR